MYPTQAVLHCNKDAQGALISILEFMPIYLLTCGGIHSNGEVMNACRNKIREFTFLEEQRVGVLGLNLA